MEDYVGLQNKILQYLPLPGTWGPGYKNIRAYH